MDEKPKLSKRGPDADAPRASASPGPAGANPGAAGGMARKTGDVKSQVAGAAAEAAADKLIGDRMSANQKRFVVAAARGAAEGATRGGGAGAGLGAAKEAGAQAQEKKNAGESDDEKSKGDAKTANEQDQKPDAKQLGAGGTSYARDQDKSADDEADRRKGAIGKTAAGAGAAAVAPNAAFFATLLLFLNWLKSFFFAMLAKALTLVQMFLAWAASIGGAVWNFITAPFQAAGAAVANAIAFVTGGAAISTSVAAAGLAAVSGFTILGLLAGIIGMFSVNVAAYDSSPAAVCRPASNVNAMPIGNPGPTDANAEKMAKTVYSTMKSAGMPDVNIAGILGNWDQESGIDPTSVQNFPTRTYTMTAEKKTAAAKTDNGIGLGQWTSGRNTLLRNYATAKGADWWDIKLQLTFMFDKNGDNVTDVGVVQGMVSTPQPTPGAAAKYYHDKWERSADSSTAQREANADKWFGIISGWSVDQSLVVSIDKGGDFIKDATRIINTFLGGSACQANNASGVASINPKSGGMTQEEAQKLVDLYNQEGDKWLDEKYGPQGGPGSCGDNHAENCVSFSNYFLNKYTTFKQYASGNGVDIAGYVAKTTGRKLTSTPTPYSVGSGPGVDSSGHTLVVLGVQGDKVILGEAGYCMYMGRVRVDSAAAMTAEGWQFVDMSDAMLPNGQVNQPAA
ncbi:phage tail tip lysozyme [Arthrobacter bambusae]|uniref:Phage tail lysozyme domain-containing protein n=1 Tax=Arthrobacter bambusae TaxID=1338426 RepID=A0AAW8DHA7_9MICC|nr:phage tail tip lysozyme [Arthrobacter bambusae]MDP9904780.1 hypothetical protein [Arthrobacter bambusae]MDQ0129596.1 hypothetical protein [Arthrobacter bambusae]MDQ0180791.1 hypothetical protein [Arthrobacter bambusae]